MRAWSLLRNKRQMAICMHKNPVRLLCLSVVEAMIFSFVDDNEAEQKEKFHNQKKNYCCAAAVEFDVARCHVGTVALRADDDRRQRADPFAEHVRAWRRVPWRQIGAVRFRRRQRRLARLETGFDQFGAFGAGCGPVGRRGRGRRGSGQPGSVAGFHAPFGCQLFVAVQIDVVVHAESFRSRRSGQEARTSAVEKQVNKILFAFLLFVVVVLVTVINNNNNYYCREAAKECRRKKKEYVKCLESRVTVLETQNKQLIEELKNLKELYCQKAD
ncbi:cAMP response element-binding protein [Trichinella spiralis]|uniref:cAMP response element-binding protein n=1 Tax=Trichinella spiralis TaxID=6334 RepID=UPI0001EFBDA1|nr:cAMP response element-binding protein [Trichinella spiralis]